jgi:hypothetical protein
MQVSGQLHAAAALSPVPTDRRLGRLQSWFERSDEKKSRRPTRSLFCILTELQCTFDPKCLTAIRRAIRIQMYLEY